LAAGDAREVLGAGLLRAEAGDGVHDFLAEELAVAVVAVAADPGDAYDLREVDSGGVGDPDRAADDAAVGPVRLRAVGGTARAAGLDGVEGGPLKGRLFPLTNRR
jgi:hypothetical protein